MQQRENVKHAFVSPSQTGCAKALNYWTVKA